MVIANPAPDGFVPTQNRHVSDAADETAVIQKFKDLKFCDRSTNTEEGGDPYSVLMTRQFEGLDISGSSPGQMDNESAQTTRAMTSHTDDPPTMLAQMIFGLEIHRPETPFDLTADFIVDSEPDLSELNFEVGDVDDWRQSLAVRCAFRKWRKKRTRIVGKRMYQGQIRNKIGGMSRHRHNASRMNLAGWSPSSVSR